MIKHIGNKWKVLSHTSGRSFGIYPTKKQAMNRLHQIEIFKHIIKRGKLS